MISFGAVKQPKKMKERMLGGHEDDHDDETHEKVEAAEVVEKLERPGRMSDVASLGSHLHGRVSPRSSHRLECKVEVPDIDTDLPLQPVAFN